MEVVISGQYSPPSRERENLVEVNRPAAHHAGGPTHRLSSSSIENGTPSVSARTSVGPLNQPPVPSQRPPGSSASPATTPGNPRRTREQDLRRQLDHLRVQLLKERLSRLKYQRDRMLTTGHLNQLKSGRWWRLGTLLREILRTPWKLSLFFRAAVTPFQRRPAPPLPDVSSIEEHIAKVSSELATLEQRLATSRPTSTQGPTVEELLRSARQLYREGRYEEALALLEKLPAQERTTKTAAMIERDCHIKLGQLTSALTCVRQAMAAKADPALERSARRLEGRLRETDPRWLPDSGPRAQDYEPANPRRILHIVKESLPYFQRGYTLRSQATFIAQRMAGYEPIVVTSLGFPRDQGYPDFPKVELIEGIPHYRLDLGPDYRTAEIPEDLVLSDQAMLTRMLADDLRPALVQAGSGYRGYETALVALSVARALGVPFIYEVRSFLEQTWTGEIDRSEQGEYYHRRRNQETRCMLEADLVYTISDAMRDEITSRGVPADKVYVVPNVVDTQRFKPRPANMELKKALGLDGLFVLGYISNLGKREGIDNLIRAVKILREHHPGVGGLVVGDGPERDALTELVASLDLEGCVTITGHVDNSKIEDYYSIIDLFVIPRIDDLASRYVVPLKPLEAMAMQRPIVAADLPALRELLGNGERGLLFPPGDPRALAEVASRMIAQESERAKMAASAYTWVQSERTIETNAQRYARSLATIDQSRARR